jgi:hypothetical protein
MALRELNVAINLSGNLSDALSSADSFIDAVRESAQSTFDSIDNSILQSASSTKEFSQEMSNLNQSVSDISPGFESLGKDIGESMVDSIPKSFGEAVKTAGKNALQSIPGYKSIKSSIDQATSSAKGFNGVMQAVAGLAIVGTMVSFASASVDAAVALERNASMAKNLAGPAYDSLSDSISTALQNSKGLTSEGELLEAANQAMKMGASVDFVSDSLSGMQMAAAVTGENVTALIGSAQRAIVTGSKEVFEKNGALFGAYMDDFNAINKMQISDADKRILREELIGEALNNNATLQEQYNSHMNTAGALLTQYDQRWGDIKETIGQIILIALKPLMEIGIKVLNWFTDSENGMKRIKLVMLALAPVVVALGVSLAVAGWNALAPWLLVAAPFLALGAAIAIAYAIFDDFATWINGGDSLIGDFFGPWEDFDLGAIIQGWLSDLWDFVASFEEIGILILGVLFPLILIYKYWDDIMKFFDGIIPNVTKYFEKSFKDTLTRVLNLFKNVPLVKALLDNFRGIGAKISGFFSGFSLSGAFKNLIPYDLVNNFIDTLNKVMGKISSVSKSKSYLPDIDWSPIARITPRREGGPLNPGETYLVAEPGTGGEIIQMGNQGGHAFPANKVKSSNSQPQIVFQFGDIILSGSNEDAAFEFKRKLMNALNSIAPEIRIQLGIPNGGEI